MNIRVHFVSSNRFESLDVELERIPLLGDSIDVGGGSAIVTHVDYDAEPVTVRGEFLSRRDITQ